MTKNVYICLLLVICSLTACSPSLREAQDVVAQADSLWHAGQMYGVDAGDSATLAQAYETLSSFSSPLLSPFTFNLSSSYVHACYHYGKLLRAKDNPVAAMEVFINATHSRTRDYHILGRVYNNMGDICHLAEEFQMSFVMFEQSGDMFLRDKDTLSYYYVLNDMAFELAEQGKKDSCFLITHELINLDKEGDMLTSYCCVSQAQACLKKQEYDSVIHYVYKCQSIREESAMALLLAQAYSYMEIRDSAVFYAELVLEKEPTLEERNNALYILTNDDDTKDRQAVLETAGERADMQKLIEIKRSKHAQAVQLLEQDINRKPNWTWLYAIIATIAFIGTGITMYTYRKRRQHQLLSQKVNEMQSKSDAIKLQHEQMVHEHADYKNKLLEHLEYNCSVLSQSDKFPNNLNWKDFDAMCIVIDNNYNMLATKLRHKYILSEKEIRLCILVLMNISRPRMAEILPYAASGIGKYKDQTAKKIGTSGKKMHAYLLEMAVGD